MKKICFLQYSLIGGGAERKVCTLANFFAENGYEVEIGLFGRNIVEYRLNDKVKLTFIDRKSYLYKNVFSKLWYYIKKVFINAFMILPLYCIEKILSVFKVKPSKKINSQKIKKHFDKKYNYIQSIKNFIYTRSDVVFISMTVQVYNEVMRLVGDEVKSGRIKNPFLVMECSNPTVGLDATFEDDRKRNLYYPLAAKCITMTEGAKNYFNEEIQKKCVIIPNPVRNDLPETFTGKRKHIVVNYCRIHNAKNLSLLIDSFYEFHKEFLDYKLEIYGKGELEDELNEQIKTLGIEDCAHIYGFDANIHEKIKDYAMYVSSSDYEGFPNSVLEALSLGMPVISTDCDFGPRDMIKNRVNGILTPVGDKEALVNAMKELAQNPVFAAKLGKEAIKTREKYDVKVIGQKWLDLIEEVSAERNK